MQTEFVQALTRPMKELIYHGVQLPLTFHIVSDCNEVSAVFSFDIIFSQYPLLKYDLFDLNQLAIVKHHNS